MKFLNIKKENLKEQETTSSEKINYNVYKPSVSERIKYYAAACSIVVLTALLFYRNLIAAAILMPAAYFGEKYFFSYKAEKRKEKLLEGFRDVLYSISASVAAGRQMPQAINDAGLLMEKSYGETSDIAVEMKRISGVYSQANADIGEMLEDFAQRSGLAEIKQFSDSYRVCKKCGADLETVCLKSASLLLDRIDFLNEVKVLISQKKLDRVLLTALPRAVLLFLNLISFSYIEVLYEGFSGRMIMTLCLLMMAAALLWGLRITNLKL